MAGMLDLGNINVNVTANTTGATNGLNQVANTSEDVVNRVESRWASVGTKLLGIGTALTAALTVPIVAFGKSVINLGTDFEQSMAQFSATSGVVGDDLKQVEEYIRGMGATTSFSAKEVADAANFMALAGWDINEVYAGMPDILNLANGAGMDLATTCDIVTDYLSAWGMSAEETGRLTDIMAKASTSSNTSVQQLADGYKNCAATANSFGFSVEDTTAMLMAFADQGLKGAEGGTALNAMIRDMTNNMKEGAIQIGETSVAVLDSNGNFRELTDIMGDIEKATAGMSDGEKALALQNTFTADSIKGVNLALGAGSESLEGYQAGLLDCEGTTKAMSDTMDSTTQGSIKKLNSAWEELKLKVWDVVKPAFKAVVDGLTGVVTAIGNFMAKHPGFTKALVVIAAALAAIGPTLAAVGTAMLALPKILSTVKLGLSGLGSAFTFLTSPVGLVIAGIAAVAAGLVYAYKHSEKFREAVNSLWEKIKVLAQTLWDDLQPVIQQVADLFQNYLVPALKVVGDFLMNTVLPAIVGLYEKSLPYIQAFYEFMIQVWSAILDVIKNVLDWLIVNVPTAIENVKNFFISFGEKCSEIFNAVKDTISGWVDAIVNFFTVTVPEAITAVVDWFKSIPDKIGAFLELAKTTISGWVDSVVNFFTVTVPNSINATIKWFTHDLIFGIAEGLSFCLGRIVKWGIDTWTYLSTNVPLWIEGVKNFFWELPGKIWDALVEAYNKVCDWASNTWNKFTEACTNIFNTVVEWFSQLPGRISEFITNAYNKVTQWASNMWNKAKEMGSNFINGVVTFFSQLPGKVWEWLNNTISKAKTFVSNMKTEASNAANGFKEKIVSGVSSIPGKMLSIGSNIVSGLKNGIKNAWSGLKSWVSNLCSSLVSGFKKGLGINSPSRVFRDEVGKWIPAGIGEGVEAKMPALIKDMKEQLGGLVANMNATVGLDTSALSNTMLGNIAGVSQAGTITSSPKSSEIINYYNDYSTGASGPIEVALKLDGRTLAKETVPYMEREIGRVQKRRSYNRGANLT